MSASPYSLLVQLQSAKSGFEDAQITFSVATTAHTEAKRALELAEAYKLCEGFKGKNEKERAAKLRLEQSSRSRWHDSDLIKQGQKPLF